MKVLLLYPEFPDTFWSFRHALPIQGKRSAYPPLGLLTVAALLPPRWEKRLVDLNVEKLSDRTLAWADVVFLSAMLVQAPSLGKLIARCRAAGKRTVVGGPVTSAAHPSYAMAHTVVRGEAEGVMNALVRDLEACLEQRRYEADGWADMTKVPAPAYGLARMDRYSAMAIQYSRGCPFACEFCDIVELFGRAMRVKTPEQVLGELDRLRSLGWRGSVFVVDDNFVGNRAALKEMLPRLADWMRRHRNPFSFYTQASVDLAGDEALLSGMRSAGFNRVFLGIETPDAASHRAAGKSQNANADLLAAVRRIQEHGIEVMGGFILGFDQDTPDIFERQVGFIRDAAIPVSMVGLLTALPNTRLSRRLGKEGRLLRQSLGDNTAAVLNYVPRMDPRTLLAGYRDVVSRLYSPKAYFERARLLISRLGPSPRCRPVLSDYLAMARSFVRQGIVAPYRLAYWRFLGGTMLHSRRHIGLAVTLAIMGHHFFVLARRMPEYNGPEGKAGAPGRRDTSRI